jgi:hypothetical protein
VSPLAVFADAQAASLDLGLALWRYSEDFLDAYLRSVRSFVTAESQRLPGLDLLTAAASYAQLGALNADLARRAWAGTFRPSVELGWQELESLARALGLIPGHVPDAAALAAWTSRQAALARGLARDLPAEVAAVAPHFGFHFERHPDALVDETERFRLYQVAPTHGEVRPEDGRKPLLIVPPYVLGANILGFLPGEDRSYAHAFANQGVPTYLRVMKEIDRHPAVQVMTGEDDVRDLRRFCGRLVERHGRPVTLNGYCQGGYSALCALLSGELAGLVDALITCVAPMDGTRSQGLAGFLHRLPSRFNDLAYGIRHLPGGNPVADGRLMGWVYRLKSIESEGPAAAFLRDLLAASRQERFAATRSRSALAIAYWLGRERTDLPLAITRMSFAAYNRPIAPDGALPVRLFDRPLHLGRLADARLPWLLCYGEQDDLVEPEAALAPTDFVPAERTAFPRGHVAIATSWSHPDSACPLHGRFGAGGRYRGPVRFHLDLEAAA